MGKWKSAMSGKEGERALDKYHIWLEPRFVGASMKGVMTIYRQKGATVGGAGKDKHTQRHAWKCRMAELQGFMADP